MEQGILHHLRLERLQKGSKYERKVQKFIFGDSKFEMTIRYSSGDAQWATGYVDKCGEFKGGVISTEMNIVWMRSQM